MLLFKPGRLRLRRASKNDYKAISYLLNEHWAVHTRLPLEEIEVKLNTRLAFLVEDQIALRGFMMVESQPPQNALIVTTAVHDNSKISVFLDLVLPAIETELRQQRLKYLIQIGEADWLNRELLNHGFEIQEEIITFEWKAQALPSLSPHPKLVIREVHISDLPDLLVLDQIVFGPVWRKPRSAFREAIERAESFVVGLIDDTLAAYAWCDQMGDHGHLTRIGTHPDYQGQGIGAHLLRHTLQSMLDLRIKTLSLNTQKNNLRSQELYRRFGFEQTHKKAGVYRKKISN